MLDRRLCVALGVAVVLGWGGPARADTNVQADLVEQNRSGVHGTVTLTATDSGGLRVRIHAAGLVPGPHAQHVHGAVGSGHFHCPSLRDDADGDGWLTNEEAMGEYGDIYLALTTRGDASARSALALDRMPVADQQGRLSYTRTLPASQVPNALLDELANLHVVQHGIDVNDNHRYDLQALGEPSFAAGLGAAGVPEEATDPASCGVVVGAGMARMPRGGVETGLGAAAGHPYGDRPRLLGVAGGAVLVLLLGSGAAARRRRGRPSR